MTALDVLRFASGALSGHRLRTVLSLVGVAIGVAAVILLTGLGEGARRYVVGEFAQLGTNLVIFLPGKSETTGGPPIFGGAPRDLTLDDAAALARHVRAIRRVAPLAIGEAPVRFGGRSRTITVAGTTAEMIDVRRLELGIGQYLPSGDWHRAPRVCVIGPKVQRELFGGRNPLGKSVHLGDSRFRVIGVMKPRGESLGMDFDDIVHVPVASAMRMFDQTSVFRILAEVGSHDEIDAVKSAGLELLRDRHDGIEDVTALTQDSVLATFSRILGILTLALGGIAAVSLTVAGVGIMNVMLVSVAERVREIGLLKALGATPGQLLRAFLVEAALLSTAGGLVGLAVGVGGLRALVAVWPVFPASPPAWAVVGSLALAILVGPVFGALPARRASRLDPVAALGGEVIVIGRDVLRLTGSALRAHRLRSALTMLGIVIGIAAVILLTSIGEGTRQYILSEFTQFGTNLIAINAGKTTTTGQPGALGGTIRKLTIEDAEALTRVPGVERVVPVAMGAARVEADGRGRSVFVYGVTSDVPDVWQFGVRQGRFLPAGDPRRSAPLAVLGPKLKCEIFGNRNALGEYVRVGGRRFKVIGVMAPKGQLLGFDIDDSVYIPVAAAQELFNRDGLVEIDVLFASRAEERAVVQGITRTLRERHDGEDDFTVTTQTEMLDVLGRVLGIVSLAVGGIGAISLVVGAVGILTMMWISVGERTAEIGLAKALGATPRQILTLFLSEALVLSAAGGAIGVAVGIGIATGLRVAVPGMPVRTPVAYVVAALAVSLAVGLASGVLPARRAASLDPVEALHAE